ncbi:hypothetical protein AGDE_13833 [Angomonas deanei]|nr:hypothetical protein AGDE_13833 [Angomonas deanei]|eukprot:EPY21728.1 hypothetical protein AGDE_13833 [Angomonas deanei]
MLSPQDQQLFGLIRMAQVQRNTLIQLLSRQRSLEAIYGCYVRVLVQLPDSQADDYVIAKVLSAVEGESYTGYSQVSGESTNVYLVVQLPPSITADNGARFQLNTISNSPMREGEFQKWLNLMRDEMPTTIPTVEDLGPIITRLQSIQSHRGRGSHDTGRTELSVSNLAMHSSGNALAAMNDRPLHGGEASSAVLPSNRSTNIPRARRSPGASMSGGVPPFHPNQIPAKTNNYTQSSRSNPNLPSPPYCPRRASAVMGHYRPA